MPTWVRFTCHRFARLLAGAAAVLIALGFVWLVLPSGSQPSLEPASVSSLTEASGAIQMRHPPAGASFPFNLAPPEFEWQPSLEIAGYEGALLAGGQQFSFNVSQPRWQPRMSAWRKVVQVCRGKSFTLNVVGKDVSGRVRGALSVSFRVSDYKCDEVVIYRLVRPPFDTHKAPHTYLREVSSFQVKPFLLGRSRYCFNCHVFSDPNKSVRGMLAIQVRDLVKGGTWFGTYDMRTGQGHKVSVSLDTAMSTFMAWHPDGRKLALAANQAIVTLDPILHVSQDAVQPTADIAIYDLDKKEVYLLPYASSADRVEVYPRFSPDGKLLAFCSGPLSVDESVKLDIYLMDFNQGQGGKPWPLAGGANNGRSNYNPRFSPDGKWISFVQADYGSLIKPSSDIFLHNRLSRRVRRLACNVSGRADSWHSWSSNSRFLLFASKRDDGIYARLYLTEITEDGHAYPAFRLPEDDFLRQASRCLSYNIPEFLQQDPQIDEHRLFNLVKQEQKAQANIRVSDDRRGTAARK